MRFRAGFAVSVLVGVALAAPALGHAAIFRVTSSDDLPDAHLADGVCRASDGACTLQAAVDNANANPGFDHIVLPQGVFHLRRGELLITYNDGSSRSHLVPRRTHGCPQTPNVYPAQPRPDLLISGGGATKTVINADGGSRAFNVALAAALSLSRLRVTNGSAFFGGAVALQFAGCLVLTSVTMDHNHSSGEGGAIDAHYGDIAIRNSAIVQNSAGGDGGGIHGEAEGVAVDVKYAANIENTTIAGNSSGDDGGGIFVNHYPMGIVSSTIADNNAERSGAAIYYDAGESGPSGPLNPAANLFVQDTIVRGACSGPTGNPAIGSIVSLGSNLESTATCGFNRMDLGDMESRDPELAGALALNGGTTPTLALLASSPAIDQGYGCPPIDQRGFSRIGLCDIGAFEYGH